MKYSFRLIILVVFFFLGAMTSGCYYDKEELLYPATNCDTSGVTYSVTVTGIMRTNCYVCHTTASAAASGGGIQLDSYAKIKVYVDNGKLIGSIKHASGYSAMPKNATKLNSCDINKIEAWAKAGAPNN